MLASYALQTRAPIEAVFATAADVAQMPNFTRDVESMEFLSAPPLQRGSRVRDTRRLLGVRRSQVITIPLFEPPARFIAEFSIFGVRFESDHLFSATGTGTHFAIRVRTLGAAGIGNLLRPFVPLAGFVVRYGIRREAEDIKTEAERRAKMDAGSSPA